MAEHFIKSAEYVWTIERDYSLNCTINTLKIQNAKVRTSLSP